MPKYLQLACLLVFLFSSASHAGKADDDNLPDALPSTDFRSKLTLQETAGIKTQTLQVFARQPEFKAYGTVISLEPLLMLHQQYLAAQAQQDSAQARYQEAHLNWVRTQNLHQHDIVSTRRLQEQQAQWQNDKANLSSSSSLPQTILATSRLQWGDTLSDWFIQDNGKQAEPFLRHRAQLLEIILPADFQLEPGVRNIVVDKQGRREQAITATLISPAPTVDPVSQGVRYFFAMQGNSLPIGTHVSAWVVSDAEKNWGVRVPESALVWHLGQAFVFVKSAQTEFDRRLLHALIPVEQGYFVADDLKPGDEVVTTGAQTLLSQELKNLIPSEDDD